LKRRVSSKDPKQKEKQVAPRQIKIPAKENSDKEAEEVISQRRRPESGRYLLQVDKDERFLQNLRGRSIGDVRDQKNNPIVQVSIYDSVDNSAGLVELPGAAS
jgi:hypothetical protein